MDEKLKSENIVKAVKLLPKAKSYPPATITVAVGKLRYTFEKLKDEWYYVF